MALSVAEKREIFRAKHLKGSFCTQTLRTLVVPCLCVMTFARLKELRCSLLNRTL